MSARLALVLILIASPAFAQWTQVPQVLPTDVFSVWADGDTVVAAADTATYVSTNGGTTWKKSAMVAPGLFAVQAAFVRNGRLYAGTGGKGVFVSDNLGDTWMPFNEGLVGGIFNSQLDISALVVRSDTLYAGTFGAGVWRRKLAPGQIWSPFGAIFEGSQASNIEDLALGGARLLAAAGGNGTIYHEDPGETDFTEVFLNNVGLAPGLQARSALWWGGGWVVGTNLGVHRSANGDNPWSFTDIGIGSLQHSAFAARTDGRLFAAFIHLSFAHIRTSGDGGATWQSLETLPGTFVYKLAASGGRLYAARADGLWRRDVQTVSVPPATARIAFSVLGAQPVSGSEVRFAVSSPVAGNAVVELYDLRGRRVKRVERSIVAAPQTVTLSTSALAPGLYLARLLVEGESATARVVLTR